MAIVPVVLAVPIRGAALFALYVPIVPTDADS
jgi:hypothetical protein